MTSCFCLHSGIIKLSLYKHLHIDIPCLSCYPVVSDEEKILKYLNLAGNQGNDQDQVSQTFLSPWALSLLLNVFRLLIKGVQIQIQFTIEKKERLSNILFKSKCLIKAAHNLF